MTSVTPEVQRCVLHLSEAYDSTATWLSLAPQTQNHSGSFGIQKLLLRVILALWPKSKMRDQTLKRDLVSVALVHKVWE